MLLQQRTALGELTATSEWIIQSTEVIDDIADQLKEYLDIENITLTNSRLVYNAYQPVICQHTKCLLTYQQTVHFKLTIKYKN